MPYKDESERIVKHKEYSRKYYEANKEKVKAKAAETKKRQRAAFADFKATLKCNRCGFNHPAALDFHHTDPTIKESIVSNLISNGCYTRAKLEMDKCEVLCANCHRLHHYNEKNPPG